MYNTDFEPQLQAFREHLFGYGCLDPRTASDEAHRRYSLPPNVKIEPCLKNENGEWVPSKLETNINS
mgnify:CR=1 FL=1